MRQKRQKDKAYRPHQDIKLGINKPDTTPPRPEGGHSEGAAISGENPTLEEVIKEADSWIDHAVTTMQGVGIWNCNDAVEATVVRTIIQQHIGLIKQSAERDRLKSVNAQLVEALKNLLGSEIYADGEGPLRIDQGGCDDHEYRTLVAAARTAIALATEGAKEAE